MIQQRQIRIVKRDVANARAQKRQHRKATDYEKRRLRHAQRVAYHLQSSQQARKTLMTSL
jgi:hypothetical protein